MEVVAHGTAAPGTAPLGGRTTREAADEAPATARGAATRGVGPSLTLYVREQGAVIRRRRGRLVVEKSGAALRTLRLRDVERLVLFGHVEVTSPALGALLDAGVETVLLSFSGRFRGRLTPVEGKNVFLRRAQFRASEDPALRLRAGRSLLAGKLRNTAAFVRQHQASHPDTELAGTLKTLDACRARLEHQETLAALMGVEGEAARAYFGSLGRMLRGELAFQGRSRRPPRDTVNALLSFGYALLTTELTGAVAAEGLDPHFGLLHELDYGRPSLALDLLEEFRQPVVDRLVVGLVNRRVLRTPHFDDRGGAGVFLNDAGRTHYLECYHRAMDVEFDARDTGERTTFRGLLQRQARRIRAVIESSTDYVPYLDR